MRALLLVSLCSEPELHIRVEAVAGEDEAGVLRPGCTSRVLEQVPARAAACCTLVPLLLSGRSLAP